jgi:hypothetical protein
MQIQDAAAYPETLTRLPIITEYRIYLRSRWRLDALALAVISVVQSSL